MQIVCSGTFLLLLKDLQHLNNVVLWAALALCAPAHWALCLREGKVHDLSPQICKHPPTWREGVESFEVLTENPWPVLRYLWVFLMKGRVSQKLKVQLFGIIYFFIIIVVLFHILF